MAEKRRNLAMDYAVYLLVRLVVCGLQAASPESGFTFARALGWIAYLVDKRHRRVAMENIRHAYPELSDRERRRMVLAVYQHFMQMIVEIAHIPRKMRVGNWKKYCDLRHAGPVVRAVLDGRPIIIVTGHFGNWEMAGYLVAAIGIQTFAIARTLDNRRLNDFLLRFRQWSGQTILDKNNDYDKIQRVLAERRVLITLGDQSAGPKGYFIDFFGRPASTHKAIALLSLEHEAPVFVGYGYRKGQGMRYVVEVSDAFEPNDFAELPGAGVALTEAFTRRFEDAVRVAPEQYLWLHNRYKHQPPARKAARAKAA